MLRIIGRSRRASQKHTSTDEAIVSKLQPSETLPKTAFKRANKGLKAIRENERDGASEAQTDAVTPAVTKVEAGNYSAERLSHSISSTPELQRTLEQEWMQVASGKLGVNGRDLNLTRGTQKEGGLSFRDDDAVFVSREAVHTQVDLAEAIECDQSDKESFENVQTEMTEREKGMETELKRALERTNELERQRTAALERAELASDELELAKRENTKAEERIVILAWEKQDMGEKLGKLEEQLSQAAVREAAMEDTTRVLNAEHAAVAEELRRVVSELANAKADSGIKDVQANAFNLEREQLLETIRAIRGEFGSMQNELQAASAYISSLQKEKAGLQEALSRALVDAVQANGREASLEREMAVSHSGRNESLRQLYNLRERLHSTERQNLLLVDQIRQQSQELQDLGPHSPKSRRNAIGADGLSSHKHWSAKEAMIAPMNSLNSEIFQVAAFMADSLQFDSQSRGEKLETEDERELIERMTKVLGTQMILLLRARLSQATAESDPLPMQIALQSCMNYCCARIIASWYPGHWEYSDFLDTVYFRIQGTEDSDTAGKWRATTRAQCKISSETPSQMSAFISEYIVDVLTLAGWTKEDSHVKDMIAAFEERISLIANLALRLNKMISEDVTPGYLEPVLIQPGALFHSDVMDNAYVEDDDSEEPLNDGIPERVMCTSDMGLRRTASGVNAVGYPVVLKPKVVLRSSLEQAL